MPRISPWIEKLENKLSAKFRKYQKKLRGIWSLLLIGAYFYGVFVNSIRLGIKTTFPEPGAIPPETIWVWNLVLVLAAIFTPAGLGVTFFLVLMTCLITKKGYSWLSGYHFTRDPRSFDILPEATHGGSGWMTEKQIDTVMVRGKAYAVTGTLLGKWKEERKKIIHKIRNMYVQSSCTA